MDDIESKIIELMDLFDEGVLTTGDKIPQPEPRKDVVDREAVNRFMRDNPMADGGRIGFAEGPPSVRGEAANIARRTDSINELYNMFGKSNVDKAFKAKHGIGLMEIAKKTTHPYQGRESKVTDLISNFKRKFVREGGEFLTEEESRIKSRKKRAFKEADLQIKLLEATNKDEFFDPKKFAKENDISLAKVKNEAKKLQKNIYVKRMLESGKENITRKLEWLPNDVNLADNALDKLYKSKLIKYERDKIDNLFYDAFGREFVQGTKKKNPTYKPEKFLAIKDQLNKYRKLKTAIQLKYPNINFELDHPLSKSTIRNLFNASAADLTRVNVLTEDLNKGFKDSLSQKYYKAVTGNNLKQKQAVEKIAKDLNLNIGKISNVPGKFSFGVKEFQKLNLEDEILKAAQTRADMSSNFKRYVKNNPELFKAAKIRPNVDLTPVTQKEVKGLKSFMKTKGIKCILGRSNGGPINCNMPEAYEKSLDDIAAKAQAGDGAAQSKLASFGKSVATAGRVIKNVLGPYAVATEVALGIPIGLYGYAKGQPLSQIANTISYGLVGKSQEERLKAIDPNYNLAQDAQTYFQDKFSKMKPDRYMPGGEATDRQKIKRGFISNKMIDTLENKKLAPFMNVVPPSLGFKQFDADRFDQNLIDSYNLLQKDEAEMAEKALERKTPFTDFGEGFSEGFSKGGIAGLSGGDKSGPPPERGPNSQGLSGLLKRGINI